MTLDQALILSFLLFGVVPFLLIFRWACRPKQDPQPVQAAVQAETEDRCGLPDACVCGTVDSFKCGDGYNDEVIVICDVCRAKACWYPTFSVFNWVSKGSPKP